MTITSPVMAASWTSEQVIALAPDAASAKAGREQSQVRKWSDLGCDDSGAWGLCQGSGKDPYQAVVDLGEPAFKCSCPSRKFPCKHGLGLLLLWVTSRAAFTAPAPTWVSEWRASRAKRTEVREAKVQAAAERAADPEAQATAAKQAAKRSEQREARVDAAVDDLQRWIGDMLRRGIADVPSRPGAFFTDQARRLVDGQAPGLARHVRELAAATTGSEWQERLLERLGRLHVVTMAWRNRSGLPAGLLEDLRQQIGFSVPQDDVLARPSVAGAWTVIGRLVGEDDNVRTARCWLQDQDGRQALVLYFAVGSQPLDTSLVAGSRFQGQLCYFPGDRPLRALVKSRESAQVITALPPGGSVATAVVDFANGSASCPWLERTCPVLSQVTPLLVDGHLWVRDAAGDGIRIPDHWTHRWRLLSWAGGSPVTLAGEFDGESFLPLTGANERGVVTW